MLFTWDTTNLCIIFHWWHVSSTATLLLSLVGVALLTAGYELVRDASRRYEAGTGEYANALPSKYSSFSAATTFFVIEAAFLSFFLFFFFRIGGFWEHFSFVSTLLPGSFPPALPFLSKVYAKRCFMFKDDDAEESRSLTGWLGRGLGRREEQRTKMVKAGFYAVQVFYSFFIM